MFSKSCEYAIRAVFFLASEPRELMGVETLAEKLQIPRHFLAKILQQLSRNQIISSTKGRNGGFFLSEENQKKTLMDVIECIEGPGIFNRCVLGLDNCSNEAPCPYHHVVKQYRDRFFKLLQKETIAESARRTKDHHLHIFNRISGQSASSA